MRMPFHESIWIAVPDFFTKKYPPEEEEWYHEDEDEWMGYMHDYRRFHQLYICENTIWSRVI